MSTKRYSCCLIALTTFFFTPVIYAQSVTITLDASKEYQTIEGLGGQHIGIMKVKNGAFYQNDPDSTYNAIVHNLGVSMVRVFLQGEWSLSNTSPMEEYIENVKGLSERTDDIRFIVTVLSPPAHMKTNGKIEEGGHLKSDMYDEFAQWCIDFLSWMKEETGVEAYALSPQNELLFKEPYGSCIYTPDEFRDVIKVLGPKMKDTGFKTKIFGPEHMTKMAGTTLSYARAVYNDPETRPYLHAIASHGYGTDGTTSDAGGPAAWRQIYNYAKDHSMQVWMTETENFSCNWEYGYHAQWNSGELKKRPGGIKMAEALYQALKYGKISGWSYLCVTYASECRDSSVGKFLYCSNGLTSLGDASKHYFRFLRPGAVQIDSESPDDSILIVAFRHKQQEKSAIVIVNSYHKTASVKLQGSGLPSEYEMYESDKDVRFKNSGKVSTNGPISLRARSIVTLSGNDFSGVAIAQKKMRTIPSGVQHKVVIFSLDGKRITSMSDMELVNGKLQFSATRSIAKGIYYVALYNANGTLLKIIPRVQLQ